MTTNNPPQTYTVGPGTIFGMRPDGINWQQAPTPLGTDIFSHTTNLQPPFRTHTWVSNWFWANGAPSDATPDDQYAVGYTPPPEGQTQGNWNVKNYYYQGAIYGQPMVYKFNGANSLGAQGLILGSSSVDLLDDGYYSVFDTTKNQTNPLDTKHLLSLKFSYLDQLRIYADATKDDAFQGLPANIPNAALLDHLGDFHARFIVQGLDENHYYALTLLQGSPFTWIQDVGNAYHTFESLSTGPFATWANIDSQFTPSNGLENLGCILVATYVKLTVDPSGHPQGGLNDVTNYYPYLIFYNKQTTTFQNASGGLDLPLFSQARGLLQFKNTGSNIINTYVLMAIPPISVSNPTESANLTPQQLTEIAQLAQSVAPYVFNIPTQTQIQYQTFLSSAEVEKGRLRTTFTLTCDNTANPITNPPQGTLICLMPHHYGTYAYDGQGQSVLDSQSPLQPINYNQTQLTYQSVRGTLKAYAGTGFTTQYIFNNFLPFMPTPKGLQPNAPDSTVAQTLWTLEAYRYNVYGGPTPPKDIGPYGTAWLANPVDTYNTAKNLSALAKEITDVEILQNSGFQGQQTNGFTPQTLLTNLQQSVKDAIAIYFQATPPRTKNQNIAYFSLYDTQSNALLLYPAGGGPNALFPLPPSLLPSEGSQDPNIAPWDGYGTVTLLNDHFFHYGYLIYSAAQLALRDSAWASQWMPVVDQLAMDIAYDNDTQQSYGWSQVAGLTYPKLRYFDQWQGHGWASGLLFGNPDGNNIESISEEINAWEGLILWGMATQRPKIAELGIYLYTTAVYASDTYWFDKLGLLRDPSLPTVSADKANATYYPTGTAYADNNVHSATTANACQVWGGKTKNSTFFGTMPVQSTAIICVPANAGSGLYLGRNPSYMKAWFDGIESFSATLKDSQNQMPVPFGELDNNGQPTPAQVRGYASFMMRVKGLGGDIADALQWYTQNVTNPGAQTGNWSGSATFIDGADSWSGSYIFLQALNDYGLPDWTWVADQPLAAVFSQNNTYTFVAFSPGQSIKVNFSQLNGSKTYQLAVNANQMAQMTVTL